MSVRTEIVADNGKEFLKVTLDETDFFLPFKLISGKKVAFLDVSGQVLLNEKSADLLVDKIKESGIKFDTILNPVAKSNALAHAVAVRWAKDVDPSLTHTVVARKAKAGDSHAVEATYSSVTTVTPQTLYLTENDVEYIKGKRVLLLDDVYGGGGTTKALYELVEKAGAVVAGHAVPAVEAGGKYPEGLIYLYELPVL